ncbi:DinB family protein [Hymenobacter lucidus]|uniref:DinB family protein n=1 Tax=Hymenobacter lucidus TaxID=2880930 RepID=A0ABS8AP75_9BACT|nr:DinB family protein [Hymenobacter lucidus]MCB2407116.1 DinB family protein [Hymenobacter lucidus]
MTELHRIQDQLTRAFNGEAWSGPSLLATLEPVAAGQAAARPLPQAHSIWEIVLHLTTWTNVVRQRVATRQSQPVPDTVDWPAQPAAPDEAQWQQALAQLRAAHELLLTDVAALNDDALEEPIGEEAGSEPGRANTVYVLLHGLAQHNLYHAGQIALLRKAAGN